MKILITGACGFVGRSLCSQFLQVFENPKLIGLDNLMRLGSETNRRPRNPDVRIVHGDIRCASDLEAVPDVDWVVDAAANPSVLAGVDGRSSSRQLVEHNLVGTLNLVEFCRQRSAGLILLSTSRVFSIAALNEIELEENGSRLSPVGKLQVGLSAEGIREDFSTTAPVSLYGATKLASETVALEYGAAFDLPVYVNRCGVLAGAGQFGTAEQGIFSYWLHAWRSGRPLRYIGFNGKGFQVRDAFHPEDLATLVHAQISRQSHLGDRIFNVGGGIENSMSLAELSRWSTERFGKREVIVDPEPRKFDVPWLVMDSARARATWDWRIQKPLPTILEEIAEHAEMNPHWLDATIA